MKRLRCPKCKQYIIFDETGYSADGSLGFQCPHCEKKFAIKLKSSKSASAEQPAESDVPEEKIYGELLVIENVFHYKQIIPLKLGNNVIGRYMKGVDINCPIKTDDPSIDMTHCTIKVSIDKSGKPKFELSDGPSNTGTFVAREILGDRERRIIDDGTLFTIGATSIILKTTNLDESENQ